MKIGAFQKLSLIDYPSRISCVVFTQGCNFRCGYCHNPRLVLPELFENTIDEKIIFEYLSNRKTQIEGVVITGGEPTIHKDLPYFIRKIKTLGFLVKLDTNGSNPKMLETLFEEKLLDFVAMDIKTELGNYAEICGMNIDPGIISESINLIKNFSKEKQFRITLLKGIHSAAQIASIENTFEIKLYLQHFRFTPTLLSNKYNQSNSYQL
jgi:pyruvate formate lyase activating enzyme